MSTEGSPIKSDLEALVTLKVKETVKAALEKIGKADFASISGIEATRLERLLEVSDAYIPITVISLACQINKTHNDADPAHSSVSECLRGTIVRMPAQHPPPTIQEPTKRRRRQSIIGSRSRTLMSGQKPARLTGFGFNTIAFLILGYFVGGFGLAPLLGLSNCTVASIWPPSLTICSAVGVLIGASLGLAYTTYFFAKKI